jgi:Rieske Fe-S protein
MKDVSRRSFLAGACGLIAIGGVSALPAAAQTALRKLPDGRIEVTLKSVPELASVGGAVAIGNVKGVPVGLTRTGSSGYKAMSLRCPHQGVTVNRSDIGWTCFAHGSEFESDGDLVRGPATRGLSRIPVSAVRKGKVIVG